MQTFLPFPNFKKSAIVLDPKRLLKQVVEARQIIDALEYGSRWSNHPAVTMWKNYLPCLYLYYNIFLQEWIDRGNSTQMTPYPVEENPIAPWWLGIPLFHLSHQSNLKRKDPDYYSQFQPDANWVYLWPEEKPYHFRTITPSWWKKLPQDSRPELYFPVYKPDYISAAEKRYLDINP